ncbi:MAG: 3-hydroxyacyl-CoA dehydrogenase family protein, partial [Pseudomonadota bacterium]
KRAVFEELDKVCAEGAILASNTSYQDVDQIALATGRPESVLGMHYFSPANVMKLLEVVRGASTSPEAMARVLKLARACGKIPVVSGVCYGFIGNRINRRLQQQAQLCLLEGATPTDIDNAMEDFGMAMGPLAVGDLAGLDIGYMARQALSDEQKGDPRTYWIPDTLAEQGRLGQKSGEGYYRYAAETRRRQEDPAVLELIVQASSHFGIQRRALDGAEIVERLLLAVVNEGARVLEERIAARASDIDLVYVNGYGFPAHEGGIMYWAERLGAKHIRSKLIQYAEQSGDENLQPAPLIHALAESGRGFSEA